MVRVERLAEASPSDEVTIRFRGQEWQTSDVYNLESELRKRFGELAPTELVVIMPPHSHELLTLRVDELGLLFWE